MLSTVALSAYLMLAGADLGQTMACIGARTCYEANPVLRPLSDHPAWYGAAKIGVSVALVGIVQRTTKPKSKNRVIAYLVLAGVQATVVGINAHRLHQTKR